MTTLSDTPAWLAAWQADNRERVEAGAKRAAEQAAQREARAAQRAARATSTPKRAATPKPRTAPAQRAQAPKVEKVKPAGAKARLHEPQGLGHDLEEPEAWAWDGGKRREQVLDHNFRPPRVVRQVGWRCCMKCGKAYFSQDVIRQRMCDGCRPEQPPW